MNNFCFNTFKAIDQGWERGGGATPPVAKNL